jgi:benzoyl-CoA reductase/2-hydroxyglutaryl-CoA dehydratase subunit BcrC/BadD/HgdB
MPDLEYFRDLVTTERRAAELAAFDGKVVGTFCNFVPEELIVAAGAVPVRLCSGDAAAAGASEVFLPRDLCPSVKATAGAVQGGQGLHGRADLLVMPTPCDGKKKLGSVLAEFRAVHVLDLPPRKDSSSARAFWLDQVKELRHALEKLTGRSITRQTLRAAIELFNRRTAAWRRFLGLRHLVSGTDALFVAQASFSDDVLRYTERLEALCAELEAKARTNGAESGGVRLLLTGAPLIWPNHKVIGLLEGGGGAVVADETCAGSQRLYQPTVLREWNLRAMLEALADKCLKPQTCPCFVDGGDRLNRILELVEAHAVQGVVYHNLRLCALFDIESFAVQRELRQRGIPMLTLATDFSQEDTGQLKNRVDAFLEMVRT